MKTQEQEKTMGLPSYSKMNGKQRWAIGKLHRVTEDTCGVSIYFQFADLSESKEKEIDMGRMSSSAQCLYKERC